MPELRVVLKNCGVVNPADIASFIANDGFKGLARARSMTPDQVIQEIKKSGLRGRGGAGFPAGNKWEFAAKSPGDEKYVICNADEGEMGTFKDRYMLQGDPFNLVEAIAIAGYAIGAKKGFIYLRAEYHFLADTLRKAVTESRKQGYLPKTGANAFDIEVFEGAGAYVCGEESSLMESLEGKRGEIRPRPPFPPVQGLWAKPTVINNVETLMNVPRIMLNGADWFAAMGTQQSKGTKVFCVAGDVKKPGVYEVAMGATVKELVVGLAGAENVKMVQLGGASGRIVPVEKIDSPLAFESVLGAGAATVFDQTRDVIDVVYKNMEFFSEESCGKCNPCRAGTQVLVGIMERLKHGRARKEDLTHAQEVSNLMMLTSLCGLGQAAPNCLLDTMNYYKDDYEKRLLPEPVVPQKSRRSK